jgi:erythromycin esterase
MSSAQPGADGPVPPALLAASDAGDQAARDAILQAYARIDAAYARGDFDGIAALALPDAQVSYGAKTSYRFALDQIRQQRDRGARLTSQTTLVAIHFSGADAIATARQEVTLSSPDGKTSHHGASYDTWTRVNGAWKLKQTTSFTMWNALTVTGPEAAGRVIAELKKYAVPLESVEPAHGFSDLGPFGMAVGGARIVALGEASHGTREFLQAKHRLLQYLVKEKGFTVFAKEAGWPESLPIDRYVKTGVGDPASAGIWGLFPEVLDMIDWMRHHNAGLLNPRLSRTLTFTSFDMQRPEAAINLVLDYLSKVSPVETARAQAAYASFEKLGPGARPDVDLAQTAADNARTVAATLDRKREEFIKFSSEPEWRDARHAAGIAQQAALRFTLKDPSERTPYRDRMMAGNVEWIAAEAHPNERIVLSAHNNHVSSSGVRYLGMGSWLRQKFGAGMYVVGFAFHRGELQDNTGTHRVPASPEGTGDAILSGARLPAFFLNLREVPANTALGRWLAEPHLFLDVGAVWLTDDPALNLHREVMTRAYDGIVFVEESHAPRPWR